jgi:hypothetical protein
MITQVAPLLIAVQHPMTVIHHLTVVQQQINTAVGMEIAVMINTAVVVEMMVVSHRIRKNHIAFLN